LVCEHPFLPVLAYPCFPGTELSPYFMLIVTLIGLVS
jgi:hypothetical protein